MPWGMEIAREARIYVAGHCGLVGSAIWRELQRRGFTRLIGRTHAELDLLDGTAVRAFYEQEKPKYVIDAAAKVGGILANDRHPAEFLFQNLQIQNNLIHGAYQAGVRKLLFLGSSCIYPKFAPQPISESALLTGELEPTPASTNQTLRWMREFNLGRKRILDTHLAAILHTSGVRRLLTSNSADFVVFGVLEIVTP